MKDNSGSFLDKKYLKICAYASVTVLLTVAALYLIYSTAGIWARVWKLFLAILRPIIIGIIISYLLHPLVSFFERGFGSKKLRKWSRLISIILSFLTVAAAFLAFAALISITAYKNISAIDFESIIRNISSMELNFDDLFLELQDLLYKAGITLGGIKDMANGILNAGINSVQNFLSGLLFGVIFSVYFLMDGGNISGYWQRVFRILFGDKANAAMQRGLEDFNRVFSGYIRGQFTDALAVLVLSCILLSVIGVPDAILVGTVIGIGNLIPYIGPIAGYIALILVCLPNGAFTELIMGAACIAIIMFVDGNIINPRLLSDHVEVHPLLVVAALIGGGAVGGLPGMVVAVPAAAFLKLQLDRYISKREEAAEVAEKPDRSNVAEAPEKQ